MMMTLGIGFDNCGECLDKWRGRPGPPQGLRLAARGSGLGNASC